MATQARGWKPTLRYSPVNGIIVNWGIGSQPFSLCGMPEAKCPEPETTLESAACCAPEQIIETVPTYDWSRWAPEVMVGMNDATEDMAASYARRAAIRFATDARVLRRQVAITLQPGETRYPIDTFPDERALDVLRIDSNLGECQCKMAGREGIFIGSMFVDRPRQEIVILTGGAACGRHCSASSSGPSHLLVTVWVAPTEGSCVHDAFLYDMYREQIAKGARGMMQEEVFAQGSYKTSRGYANSRGDQLTYNRTDRAEALFNAAIRKARVDADTQGQQFMGQPSSMWDRR